MQIKFFGTDTYEGPRVVSSVPTWKKGPVTVDFLELNVRQERSTELTKFTSGRVKSIASRDIIGTLIADETQYPSTSKTLIQMFPELDVIDNCNYIYIEAVDYNVELESYPGAINCTVTDYNQSLQKAGYYKQQNYDIVFNPSYRDSI